MTSNLDRTTVATRLSVWPTLPPRVYTHPPSKMLPFPLSEDNCRLFSRARHGLWHGVKSLGLQVGDRILVPAYHHGSEVEALIRAGLECHFYEPRGSLEPDEDELESLLDERTRALYLIHYFGIPQHVDRWRAWSDRRGLLLIEDAAMGFLASWGGRPVGTLGELAIFCLYKSFALPDGGALFMSVAGPHPTSKRGLGFASVAIRHSSWLAQRSTVVARLHARLSNDREPAPGRDFGLGDPNTPPTLATLRLLPRVTDPAAAERRRHNYHFLAEALEGLVRPLFPAIPEGASPAAFPILTVTGHPIQSRLRRRGILAARFWEAPHPILPDRFERSRSLRARVLGLPVHQELRLQDLERIAASVRAILRGPP
jgi:dTDP-4-amino-4,6-dideoxygalactose transaminase